MRRREFITHLSGAATVWPIAARAQQTGRIYRIGFLNRTARSDMGSAAIFAPFIETMREHGFVEGANLIIEERAAHGKETLFPAFAVELVRMKVDLLLTLGASATLAAKRATQTIPIVMISVVNPERLGLVTNLARPEGNVTGLSNLGAEYSGKLVEFIKEAMPVRNRVAVLWNPDNAGSAFALKQTQMPLARALGIELIPAEMRSAADVERAFGTITRERAQVLLAHVTAWPYRNQILEFARRHDLPLVASTRDLAPLGALITFGPNLRADWRRVASYVVRILRGARPGELPVEQPSKFELVVNLKTAKALGIAIPPELLARADEVIE